MLFSPLDCAYIILRGNKQSNYAKPIDVLLTPTKIYVKSILELIEKVNVKGIAHITGGGFIENIPRIFPEGIGCRIDTKSYEVPSIFLTSE